MDDEPAAHSGLVKRSRVAPVKRELARHFRRHMTQTEQQLWACLRGNRLGGFQFRRQQTIDGFIVDFYCHAAAVVVEVDGPVHECQAEEDAAREEALRLRGLQILRFTNDDIAHRIERALQQIRTACLARTTAPQAVPE